MQEPRIVVGVDGSEGSRRALTWAAREAAVHGVALDVVHTYDPADIVSSLGTSAMGQTRIDPATEGAQDLVDGLAAGIDGVEVTTRAIESHDPAQTLIDESVDATMLVVSSRGRGSVRSMLLGSVSQECAQRAECPAVIVRADA